MNMWGFTRSFLDEALARFPHHGIGVLRPVRMGQQPVVNELEGLGAVVVGGATWTALPGNTVVSMNMWGFTRSFLDEALARFPAFLDKALVENPLKGDLGP